MRVVVALLLLALAVPAAAAANGLDPHASFLDRKSVELPARSRILDSVDRTGGCGTAPGSGRIGVDGDPSDWGATPTMVAGTGRYDRGEYVWTDYPYDDDGTGSFRYPGEGEALAPADGTVGTATEREARYGSNAADVTELRVTADSSYLYVLVRFNFLNAVDSTVVGLALDTDRNPGTGAVAWPRGARMQTPGSDLFVTAFGSCGFVQRGGTEQRIDAAGGATAVGTRDNTMEIAIPRALLGGADRVRLAAGSGLWDAQAGAWMAPSVGGGKTNSTDRPTGAATGGDPALFNLLFRDDERTADGPTNVQGASGTGNPRTFQNAGQHAALKAGGNGRYALDLALDRLVQGAASDPLPARRGDELDFTRVVYSRIDAEGVLVNGNTTLFLGRWEPYGAYVPACFESRSCPWPGQGPPLALLLHGGGGSHVSDAPRESIPEGGTDLYGVAGLYRSLERSVAPVLVRPLGRGQRPPWWRGIGEADALEVLEDATRRYGADPARRVVTGASLGGYGTLRLGSVYPDLWGAAGTDCPAGYQNSVSANYTGNVDQSAVPFTIDPLVRNLLNVTYKQRSGQVDPLVPIVTGRRLRDDALAARLDLRYDEYQLGSHCFDAAEGGYPWLANHATDDSEDLRRTRTEAPAEVVYGIDARHYPAGPEPVGAYDIRDLGIDYDGAYWVSGMEPRSAVIERAFSGRATDADVASIDAVSHARAGWRLGVEECGSGSGTGPGDGGDPHIAPRNPTPHTWLCQAQTHAGDPANAIDAALRNVDSVTVDLAGAGIDGRSPIALRLIGDGPATVRLARAGAPVLSDGGCVTGAQSEPGATTLQVRLGDDACGVRLGVPLGQAASATGGGAVPAGCARLLRPRSQIKRRRSRVKRHRIALRGFARHGRPCGGRRAAVAGVVVSVARLKGGRCRFLGLEGRLGRRRRCRAPVLLRARGRTSWRLRMKVRLPRGRYRIRSVALDRSGVAESRHVRANLLRTRLR